MKFNRSLGTSKKEQGIVTIKLRKGVDQRVQLSWGEKLMHVEALMHQAFKNLSENNQNIIAAYRGTKSSRNMGILLGRLKFKEFYQI